MTMIVILIFIIMVRFLEISRSRCFWARRSLSYVIGQGSLIGKRVFCALGFIFGSDPTMSSRWRTEQVNNPKTGVVLITSIRL